MIKDIVKDEEILSQVCEPATAEDAEIAQDLVDTLLSLDTAACLAANQIGVPKAIVAYLNTVDKPIVLFNPRMVQGFKPYNTFEECLSYDDAKAVRRFQLIRIEYDDLEDGQLVHKKKKLEGWAAEVVQHTIDHCNGVLV